MTKAGHVASEQRITVGKTALKQDVNLYLLGDVNMDEKIDSTDAILHKRHMLKIALLTGQNAVAADMDENGSIDSTDYIMLKRILLGIAK